MNIEQLLLTEKRMFIVQLSSVVVHFGRQPDGESEIRHDGFLGLEFQFARGLTARKAGDFNICLKEFVI
jgi:hypothetical protein